MKKRAKKSLTRREFLETTGKVALGTWLSTNVMGMAGTKAHAAKKTTVTLGINVEAIQLNPLLYTRVGPESVPEALMFDNLWGVDENGDFYPNLTTRVPSLQNGGISPDGLVWKVELKRGVKWKWTSP